MAALEKVLQFSREKTDHIMKFYKHLIQNITSLEYSNLQLTRNLEQQQLLEQQLLASIKKAEMANEIKDRFMSNMSHELRTPLNGLMGMLQLAEMTELTEEQRELIEQALQSCQSLTDVVGDILNHTGLIEKEVTLEEEKLNVHKIMQEVKDLHQITAFQKGLTIYVDQTPHIPEELLGDRYKIKQILNNLVGNAVKFTEQGHVHMMAKLHSNKDSQEATLELRVMDTGTGIPVSLQDHTFQAFTQADNSSTRAHDGLGLGLATVKKLAEIMDGGVSLKSSPGKGSTFTVNIKVKISPEIHLQDYARENLELIAKENNRVLIVDDEAMNRKLLHRLLNREGFQIDIAVDGRDAATKAKEIPYAVILMDLNMPKMDGFEATKEIASSPVNSNTPVLAVTAMKLPDIKERCLAAGMKEVIFKPVHMEKLKGAICEWIK